MGKNRAASTPATVPDAVSKSAKDGKAKQPVTKDGGIKQNQTNKQAAPKPPAGPAAPQKAVFARLSYLYQAATHLAQAHTIPVSSKQTNSAEGTSAAANQQVHAIPLSRFYLSSLLTTSRKSVLRLDPSIKRSICKRCHSLLVPGVSSRTSIENKSKGGKKRKADVLCVECDTCGAVKRFPVGEGRTKKDRSGAIGAGQDKKDVGVRRDTGKGGGEEDNMQMDEMPG